MTSKNKQNFGINLIGYFLANSDINFIATAIFERFSQLDDVLDELTANLDINNARGKWLDFIGQELGANRDEVDYGNYFCTNLQHCNVNRNFYFLSSLQNPNRILTLDDAEFIQKIYAYIFKNLSCGRFDEFIRAVKLITGAQNVQIAFPEIGVISINILGDNILLTPSALKYIQTKNICEGIYIKEITINE